MSNNVRILSNVSLTGTLSFASNFAGFPANPAPRTMVVKDGVPYLYTELVNGSGYYTWTPIGARQAAHLHTQGVASLEWTVTHNFNSVNFGYFVYDQDHNMVLANTQIIDANTVKVLLTSAITGTAVFFSMETIFTQMVNASTNVQIATITLRDAAGVLTVNNNPVAMAEAVAASFAQVYTKAQTNSAIVNAVAVETSDRIAADNALTARIDDLVRGSSSALDSLLEISAAFAAADGDLSQAITNALGTHTSELNSEILNREEADATHLGLAKGYTDTTVATEADARVQGDLTTLNAAKAYTNSSIETLAAGTVAKADKLSTARSINGITFDGSADIDLTTDNIGEGANNLYFTNLRSRSAISVTGSGASYDALSGVISINSGVTSIANRTGDVVLTSADVGLGNVDNTSDANKPVSTAQAAANTAVQTAAATDATTKANAAQAAAIAASTPVAHVGSGGSVHAVATTSAAGFMSVADKTKLDGIATGATAYVHPTNHPASIITQDANNRFVTDAEKATWDAKQNALTLKTINGNSILGSGDIAVSPSSLTSSQITTGLGYTPYNSTNPNNYVSTTSTSVLTNKTITSGIYSGNVDVTGTVMQSVIAMPALDINCAQGNYFTKTISSNSTFTFSSVPSSRAYSCTLEVTHTAGSITWPASVQWPGNTAPTLTTGKTHLFMFVTDDSGVRWRGAALVDYTT